MKLIRALFEGNPEVFIVSNSVDTEDFKKSLKYIRNQTWGNWERKARTIVSVEEVNNIKEIIGKPMKYIVSDDEDNGKEIFIFEKTINHDCMYEVLNSGRDSFRTKVSAGFTDLKTCYGRSETLNLESNLEDIHLII